MDIKRLEEVPQFSSQVISWLKSEWGEMEILNAARNIRDGKQADKENSFPMIFVGLENEKLVGTISLLENDMDIRPNLNPWLGCLYVENESRHKGMGSQLFDFCESYANSVGVSILYLFTSKIQKIALTRKWKSIEEVFFEDEMVTVMCKEFETNEQ